MSRQRNSKKRFTLKRTARRLERLIAAKTQADELYRQQQEADTCQSTPKSS